MQSIRFFMKTCLTEHQAKQKLEQIAYRIQENQSFETLKDSIRNLDHYYVTIKQVAAPTEKILAINYGFNELEETLLHIALDKITLENLENRTKIVLYLLKHNADPNQGDYCTVLPLSYFLSDFEYQEGLNADKEEGLGLIEILLKKSPGFFSRKEMGYGSRKDTCLHEVARHPHSALFLFLAQKATLEDLMQKNDNQTTPLDCFQKRHGDKKFNMLLDELKKSGILLPEQQASMELKR